MWPQARCVHVMVAAVAGNVERLAAGLGPHSSAPGAGRTTPSSVAAVKLFGERAVMAEKRS
jgi:hypothetical protein